MNMPRKLLCIIRAFLIALIILTGAIALPILCRPFFYLHIAPLRLPEAVSLSVAEVKIAYNEMMNFCIGVTKDFSAGALPFSVSGMEHFADVRKLFVLDLWVLLISCVLLVVIALLQRKKSVSLLNHTPGFWSAVGLGAAFVMIGGLAATDFDRAFVIFHQLFFPGKSNWLFDGRTDPIIYMLPAEFFRNCAILILAGILISCAVLILHDHRLRKKR